MTSASKRRVLVVEDDPLTAKIIAQYLLRGGFEVVGVVDNGEDAVVQAAAQDADLVLMDIGLRGLMDGAEAALQIRQNGGRPVIFVSEHCDISVLRRVKESEPFGFIVKPFAEEQLIVQIELALHRYQLEAERANLRPAQAVANEHLRELQGLLPICAGCKKIHEDDGRWTKPEEYFGKHADIEFTHSFCPDCENRLYGTNTRPPLPPRGAS